MSNGRRRTTLEKLAEEIATTPVAPAQVQRSKRARKKADALAGRGRHTGGGTRSPRTAPEATTSTVARHTQADPDGRCHHLTGCDEPAVEGRWSCARHLAQLEARAAHIRRDANRPVKQSKWRSK